MTLRDDSPNNSKNPRRRPRPSRPMNDGPGKKGPGPKKQGEDEDDSNPKGFSSDGKFFFGMSPTERKDARVTRDAKRLNPMRDLNLDAAPRRNHPEKVGKSARLIDFALDDQEFRPDEKLIKKKDGDLPELPPFKKLDKKPGGKSSTTRRRRLSGRRTARHLAVSETSILKRRGLPGQTTRMSPNGDGPRDEGSRGNGSRGKVTAPPRPSSRGKRPRNSTTRQKPIERPSSAGERPSERPGMGPGPKRPERPTPGSQRPKRPTRASGTIRRGPGAERSSGPRRGPAGPGGGPSGPPTGRNRSLPRPGRRPSGE